MKNLDDIHRQTIQIYEKHALGWDKHRPRVLFEQYWLDQFIKALPEQASVLDVGCGAGVPIAEYLLQRGLLLTGLDAALSMLALCQSRFPDASWVHRDMRDLNLETKFDGILSWDSFFHLKQAEQRQLLPVLAKHVKAQGVLLLTIGHEAGEVTGTVEGETVYHASLAVDEYVSILNGLGFNQFEIKLEDEDCGFHSVLLAKRG